MTDHRSFALAHTLFGSDNSLHKFALYLYLHSDGFAPGQFSSLRPRRHPQLLCLLDIKLTANPGADSYIRKYRFSGWCEGKGWILMNVFRKLLVKSGRQAGAFVDIDLDIEMLSITTYPRC